MGGRRKSKARGSGNGGLRKPPPAEPPSASDIEDSMPKRHQRQTRPGTGRPSASTFVGKRSADPPADPPDRSRRSVNHTRRAAATPSRPNHDHPDAYHTDNSLLEDEEEMYSQLEEQMYSHQSLVVESESESSHQPISCRQFNLNPIFDIELANVKEKNENRGSNKIQKARVSKKNETRQREAPLSYMLDDDSEDEEDVDALLDACDVPTKTHEEFYNEDSSTDEDDEERPLRRSGSSNDLRRRLRRTRATSVLGSWEIVLNRCLVLSFCIVGLIYVREHTPGYKKDASLHHHHHALSNTDDDDDTWRRPIDPMSVYNTNDDDSTHTKDHDPTHSYDKYTNRDASKPGKESAGDVSKPDSKYSKESAGVRISERAPDKSLHHGFMDAEYEDRPASRNSASTALDKSDKRVVSEEDKAFLESVIRHPAAPQVKSLPSETDDVEDKGKLSQMNQKTNRPEKPTGYAESIASRKSSTSPPSDRGGVVTQGIKSARNEAVTGSDFQFDLDGIAPNNDFDDDGNSIIEWGGKSEVEVNEMPGENGSVLGSDNNLPSGADFLSNVNPGPASPAKSVKSVYDQTFQRWNHEYSPGQDLPLLWRIPRSASATFEAILSFCYGMVLASSMGATEELVQELGVLVKGNGARYINVDTSTLPGIERAKQLKLVESDVDVVTTPFIYEAAGFFDGSSRTGKCFTLLRHPVDRAVSLYHHYQLVTNTKNPNTSHYRGMTIDQYSDEVSENNWMVRFLSNKRSGPLSWHDLENAKEVFGRKCLVGLLDEAEESLKRYERFFHWQERVSDPTIKDQCISQYLANGDKRKEHPTYEGTQAWETLRKKNEYDVLLFEYAKNLFTQQSAVYDKIS